MRARFGVMAGLSAMLFIACAGPAEVPSDGSSFAIRPDYAHKEIYDVYGGLREAGRSQFVTTDLVLHTGHLLFDYSLRAIEIEKLYGLAEKLTKAMVKSVPPERFLEVPYMEVGNDLGTVRAYFCVPAKILDPEFEIPPTLKERVENDLAYIEKHEGFQISAVVEAAEDFSQYVPRGHYTRNEQFKRYFKVMMWYGRRMFRVAESRPDMLPIADRWSAEHKLAETRQMLIVTRMLHEATIDGEPAIETWKKLYVPTALFAGRTEDLNPMEVKTLAEKVWGKLPDLRGFGSQEKLLEFARLASDFSKPKIDSSGAGREGFCFMAQRFTPDSYITQCLVTDADSPFGEGVPAHPLVYGGSRKPRPFTWGINQYLRPRERRFMPRGLDVMAVFGCDEAVEILTADGDTEYKGYDEMLAFLRKDVGEMMARRKAENLYYAWLHALGPMLKPIESKHVPACLRSRGWLRKQLATSLASWAELRHDTILYVKQSYTPAPRAAPSPRRVANCYLEPQPEVYRRIGRMVAKMRNDLGALGVMPKGLEGNYERFSTICGKLAAIAEKELAGKQIADVENEFLFHVAGSLKGVTMLPWDLRKKLLSEADSQMALIADVHTDTNAEEVLEEGVGTPFLLTVRMPLAGKMTALHGAVFSYYEFKHPMKDRLTDEAWQKMLADSAGRPALPAWSAVGQ